MRKLIPVTGNMPQVTIRPVEKAGYKKLIVWKLADELVHLSYDYTVSFPKEEIYSLTSQLRRASLSVVANIIEGHARNSRNEFRHFLSISLGSLAEVEYYLEFSLKRKYLTSEQFEQIDNVRDQCGKLLWKLYKSQSD